MLGNSVLALKKLRKNLALSKAVIEGIQRDKLMRLINHAYRNVPYYRRLFDDHHVKPGDIRGVGDLNKIPVTDKAVLRALGREEIAAANINIKECVDVFTSGSTGRPTTICFTREDYELIDLVYLRSFLENGLRFRHKRAFVLDPHSFDTKNRWYHRLGLARYVNISCFSDPADQVQALLEAGPDFIHGYPSSLSQISKFMIDRGTNGISPAIVSTAAELLHRRDRERITRAFGVSPYDRYAARECGNIAWECDAHRGYHINSDTLVVEIIKDGLPAKPGERGDVVVTNLHSYAMPFVRYRIGDVGRLSEESCPCGLELPLMEIIEGRDEDFIILKDGKRISPMMVTGTLDYIPGVKQFKVIQETPDSMLVLIARGKNFQPDSAERAKMELQGLTGSDMDIECQVVDDIPRETSGKVRAVVSKVVSAS